jgi:TRAP-type C4-dicarboxylate transport system substrate-binding protein
MNQDVYNKMPEDVKGIIADMKDSGEYVLSTARGQDEVSAACKDKFFERGGKIPEWSETDIAKMSELLAPMWAKWIADGEAAGLPAKKALDDWYSIMEGLGVENPTPGYTPEG